MRFATIATIATYFVGKALKRTICLLLGILAFYTILYLHASCSFFSYIWNPQPYGHRLLTLNANLTQSSSNATRFFHQTYKTDWIPDQWKEAHQSCLDLLATESGWQYKLWTDEDGRNLIAEHYPKYLATFDSYPYAIQRADALRYFILHHHGGIYMDLDVGCRGPFLLPLLANPVTLPQTQPIGFSNDVMASAQPNHPFFTDLIAALPSHNHYWGTKYPTVFASTGPLFLSIRYGLSAWREDVWIIPNELYGNGPNSFFRHIRGNSWHGWDAVLILWFWKWGNHVLFVVAVLAVGGFLWRAFFRRLAHKTKRLKMVTVGLETIYVDVAAKQL